MSAEHISASLRTAASPMSPGLPMHPSTPSATTTSSSNFHPGALLTRAPTPASTVAGIGADQRSASPSIMTSINQQGVHNPHSSPASTSSSTPSAAAANNVSSPHVQFLTDGAILTYHLMLKKHKSLPRSFAVELRVDDDLTHLLLSSRYFHPITLVALPTTGAPVTISIPLFDVIDVTSGCFDTTAPLLEKHQRKCASFHPANCFTLFLANFQHTHKLFLEYAAPNQCPRSQVQGFPVPLYFETIAGGEPQMQNWIRALKWAKEYTAMVQPDERRSQLLRLRRNSLLMSQTKLSKSNSVLMASPNSAMILHSPPPPMSPAEQPPLHHSQSMQLSYSDAHHAHPTTATTSSNNQSASSSSTASSAFSFIKRALGSSSNTNSAPTTNHTPFSSSSPSLLQQLSPFQQLNADLARHQILPDDEEEQQQHNNSGETCDKKPPQQEQKDFLDTPTPSSAHVTLTPISSSSSSRSSSAQKKDQTNARTLNSGQWFLSYANRSLSPPPDLLYLNVTPDCEWVQWGFLHPRNESSGLDSAANVLRKSFSLHSSTSSNSLQATAAATASTTKQSPLALTHSNSTQSPASSSSSLHAHTALPPLTHAHLSSSISSIDEGATCEIFGLAKFAFSLTFRLSDRDREREKDRAKIEKEREKSDSYSSASAANSRNNSLILQSPSSLQQQAQPPTVATSTPPGKTIFDSLKSTNRSSGTTGSSGGPLTVDTTLGNSNLNSPNSSSSCHSTSAVPSGSSASISFSSNYTYVTLHLSCANMGTLKQWLVLLRWLRDKQSNVSTPFNVQRVAWMDTNLTWGGENLFAQFGITDREHLVRLGGGGMANVYLITHQATKQKFALKVFHHFREVIQHEIEIMQQLSHPLCIQFLGCIPRKTELYVIMEYADAGSLSDFLHKKAKEKMKEIHIAYILRQVLRALQYLHSLSILHRDIKAGNILLTTKGYVKLTDFGISEHFANKKQSSLTEKRDSGNNLASPHSSSGGLASPPQAASPPTPSDVSATSSSSVGSSSTSNAAAPATPAASEKPQVSVGGSPLWMSPEALRGLDLHPASDVYSLGIVAIEIAEGKPPNSECKTLWAVAQAVFNNPSPTLQSHAKSYPNPSSDFQDFVNKCLAKNMDDRWTVDQLLQHPFIVQPASHSHVVSRADIAPFSHVKSLFQKMISNPFSSSSSSSSAASNSNSSATPSSATSPPALHPAMSLPLHGTNALPNASPALNASKSAVLANNGRGYAASAHASPQSSVASSPVVTPTRVTAAHAPPAIALSSPGGSTSSFAAAAAALSPLAAWPLQAAAPAGSGPNTPLPLRSRPGSPDHELAVNVSTASSSSSSSGPNVSPSPSNQSTAAAAATVGGLASGLNKHRSSLHLGLLPAGSNSAVSMIARSAGSSPHMSPTHTSVERAANSNLPQHLSLAACSNAAGVALTPSPAASTSSPFTVEEPDEAFVVFIQYGTYTRAKFRPTSVHTRGGSASYSTNNSSNSSSVNNSHADAPHSANNASQPGHGAHQPASAAVDGHHQHHHRERERSRERDILEASAPAVASHVPPPPSLRPGSFMLKKQSGERRLLDKVDLPAQDPNVQLAPPTLMFNNHEEKTNHSSSQRKLLHASAQSNPVPSSSIMMMNKPAPLLRQSHARQFSKLPKLLPSLTLKRTASMSTVAAFSQAGVEVSTAAAESEDLPLMGSPSMKRNQTTPPVGSSAAHSRSSSGSWNSSYLGMSPVSKNPLSPGLLQRGVTQPNSSTTSYQPLPPSFAAASAQFAQQLIRSSTEGDRNSVIPEGDEGEESMMSAHSRTQSISLVRGYSEGIVGPPTHSRGESGSLLLRQRSESEQLSITASDRKGSVESLVSLVQGSTIPRTPSLPDGLPALPTVLDSEPANADNLEPPKPLIKLSLKPLGISSGEEEGEGEISMMHTFPANADPPPLPVHHAHSISADSALVTAAAAAAAAAAVNNIPSPRDADPFGHERATLLRKSSLTQGDGVGNMGDMNASYVISSHGTLIAGNFAISAQGLHSATPNDGALARRSSLIDTKNKKMKAAAAAAAATKRHSMPASTLALQLRSPRNNLPPEALKWQATLDTQEEELSPTAEEGCEQDMYDPSPNGAYSEDSPDIEASASPSHRDHALSRSDLYVLGVIGKGQNGQVLKAIHLPSLTRVALKSIYAHDRSTRHQLLHELTAYLHFDSPYLVSFLGAFYEDSVIFLATEYMDKGSLQHLIKKYGALYYQESLTPRERELVFREIAFQAIQGLKHMHDHHSLHRDIKPDNLLVDHRHRTKIADFGLLKDLGSTHVMCSTFLGTMSYLAPERITSSEYSYPSDVWAMGLVFLYVLLGISPKISSDFFHMMDWITKNEPERLTVEKYPNLSADCCDFVNGMLAMKPTDRYSCDQLLEHSFLKDFDVNSIGQGWKSVINPTSPRASSLPATMAPATATATTSPETDMWSVGDGNLADFDLICEIMINKHLLPELASKHVDTIVSPSSAVAVSQHNSVHVSNNDNLAPPSLLASSTQGNVTTTLHAMTEPVAVFRLPAHIGDPAPEVPEEQSEIAIIETFPPVIETVTIETETTTIVTTEEVATDTDIANVPLPTTPQSSTNSSSTESPSSSQMVSTSPSTESANEEPHSASIVPPSLPTKLRTDSLSTSAAAVPEEEFASPRSNFEKGEDEDHLEFNSLSESRQTTQTDTDSEPQQPLSLQQIEIRRSESTQTWIAIDSSTNALSEDTTAAASIPTILLPTTSSEDDIIPTEEETPKRPFGLSLKLTAKESIDAGISESIDAPIPVIMMTSADTTEDGEEGLITTTTTTTTTTTIAAAEVESEPEPSFKPKLKLPKLISGGDESPIASEDDDECVIQTFDTNAGLETMDEPYQASSNTARMLQLYSGSNSNGDILSPSSSSPLSPIDSPGGHAIELLPLDPERCECLAVQFGLTPEEVQARWGAKQRELLRKTTFNLQQHANAQRF